MNKFKFATLVFIAAVVLVIANFRFLYMAGGDQAVFMNPKGLWEGVQYAWDQYYVFTVGGQTISTHIIMPFFLFFKVFSFLPNLIVEYLYFAVTFTAIFLASFYYFYTYLFGKNVRAALTASLLYFFNMFFFVSYVNYNIHLAFILLPLLFILCHRIIEFNAKNIILILMFISVVLPAVFINPPALFPQFPAAGLYLVFLIFKNKISILNKRLWTSLLLTGILAFSLNIWWLHPFFRATVTNSIGGAAQNIASRIFETTSLHDAFRFMGGWAFNPSNLTVKNSGRYDSWYYTPLFLICTYAVVFYGLLSVFFAKKNKYILFFLILGLLFLFFIKGTLLPFGHWYRWAFSHIPGFFMFREPFTKFMLPYVFSVAILCGFTVLNFGVGKFAKTLHKGMLICLIVAAAPFIWGGWVPLRGNVGASRSYLVKVPEYVFDIAAYVSEDPHDYRLASFPKVTHTYLWESGFNISSTSLTTFFNKPVISNRADIYTKNIGELLGGVYDLLWKGDKSFINILELFNVGVLIQENDVDWRYRFTESLPPSASNALLEETGFERIAEFGKFTPDVLAKISNKETDDSLRNEVYVELLDRPAQVLYQVPSENFLPHIYTAKSDISFLAKPLDFSDIIGMGVHEDRPVYHFVDTAQDISVLGRSKYIAIVGQEVGAAKGFNVSDWHLGWSWPEPSVSPSSLLYLVARLKEKYDLVTIEDPIRRVDQLAWLIAKRAQEVSIYSLPEDKRIALKEDMVSQSWDLLSKLENLHNIDEDTRWEVLTKSYMYVSRAIMSFVERGFDPLEFEAVYLEFDKLVGYVPKESCGVGCFVFNVPLGGTYDLLVKNREGMWAQIDSVVTDIDATAAFLHLPNNAVLWHVGWVWPTGVSYNQRAPIFNFKERIQLLTTRNVEKRVDLLTWLIANRAVALKISRTELSPKLIERYLAEIINLTTELIEISNSALFNTPVTYWESMGKAYMYVKRASLLLNATEISSPEVVDLLSSYTQWLAKECAKESCLMFNPLKSGEYDTLIYKENTTWEKSAADLLNNQLQVKYAAPKVSPVLFEEQYTNETPTLFKEIKGWLPRKTYKISFDYRIRASEFAFTLREVLPDYSKLGENVDDIDWEMARNADFPFMKKAIANRFFKKSQTCLSVNPECFSHFEMFVNSRYNSAGAYLEISAPIQDTENSLVDVRNITVEEVYDSVLVLRMTNPVSGEAPPKIAFSKINPTRYRINVRGAVAPFNLVFSESFNVDWKLFLETSLQDIPPIKGYFNDEIIEGSHSMTYFDTSFLNTWNKIPIANKEHRVANGYANVWYIRPDDVGNKEDYDLILEFVPQRQSYIVLAFSLLTCCLGSLYVLIFRRKHVS